MRARQTSAASRTATPLRQLLQAIARGERSDAGGLVMRRAMLCVVLARAVALGASLLIVSSLPGGGPFASVTAQSTLTGRVLASARGQVAWLDLQAPRPAPLTQLVRPAYPADVAAAPGVPFAVASIVGPLAGGTDLGGDLIVVDLQSGSSRTLLARQSSTESLDLPAIWPDGSGIIYQRSNLGVAVPMPGQAQPQYRSRVEQIDPDGTTPVTLLEDARYPGPGPDGSHFAFVRSSSNGAGIFIHALTDGADSQLVAPGQFLALAYPRFSPDGQQVAFAAISLLAPIGRTDRNWFGPQSAMAHGFPWEAWLVNTDGSGRHQLADVQDDDPSVAWSPDGSQILVYGGWGSYVVDAARGTSESLSFLAGYGSVSWLPN